MRERAWLIEVFRLHYQEQLSQNRIAKHLGLPRSTVNSCFQCAGKAGVRWIIHSRSSLDAVLTGSVREMVLVPRIIVKLRVLEGPNQKNSSSTFFWGVDARTQSSYYLYVTRPENGVVSHRPIGGAVPTGFDAPAHSTEIYWLVRLGSPKSVEKG